MQLASKELLLSMGEMDLIVSNRFDVFSFVGRQPLVFKPGMPFETQIAVRYSDQVL